MSTAIYTHPDCQRHEMGDWHPESPARLHAVLHHDVQLDMRQACMQVTAAHGAAALPLRPSSVQVVTPCNLPQP